MNILTKLRLCLYGELLLFVITAVIAFFLSRLFIFPGYIASLAPHHADVYGYIAFSQSCTSILSILLYPRCVMMLFIWIFGLFGLKFLMAAIIFLTFINSALVLYILETFYLLKKIPLVVVLLSQFLFFSLPGYYLSCSYDIGGILAVFFGLLGILALEGGNKKYSIVLLFFFSLLSVLSKENFIIALECYLLFYLFIHKAPLWRFAAIIAIPIISFIIAYLDAKLTCPVFLGLNKSIDHPYYVSLLPHSIFETALFYLNPFLSYFFLSAFLLALIISFTNKKLLLFIAIFVISIACYIPYWVIPNHQSAYYYWTGMSVLICIIPIIFYSDNASFVSNLIKRIIIVTACFCVLYHCRYWNCKNINFSLAEEEINRNIIEGINNNKASLQMCSNILVCGLNFPFHPWHHPYFLKKYLNYSGKWDLLFNENLAKYQDNALVHIVKNPSLEEVKKYDRILIFNKDGKLTKIITPSEYQENFNLELVN